MQRLQMQADRARIRNEKAKHPKTANSGSGGGSAHGLSRAIVGDSGSSRRGGNFPDDVSEISSIGGRPHRRTAGRGGPGGGGRFGGSGERFAMGTTSPMMSKHGLTVTPVGNGVGGSRATSSPTASVKSEDSTTSNLTLDSRRSQTTTPHPHPSAAL